MGVSFDSNKQFRECMDAVFTLMSEDADMGPKLKAADVPQRFDFDDVDMVVNIRPSMTARRVNFTGHGPMTSTGSRR